MRVGIKQGDRHIVLDIVREGDSYRVNDGSADRIVKADLVGAAGMLLEVDGKRHRASFAKSNDTLFVAIDGESYALTREQPNAGGSQVAAVASPEIVAPMPGRVIQVLVKPGDAVASGDTLLILEAMKMENRLLAEAAGVVDAVKVAQGQLVEGGQVLAVLKYDQEGPAD